MDDTALRAPALAADDAPQRLAWTAHPLREEPPARSAALLAAIVGVAVLASWSFGSAAYGAVSVVVLTLAMAGYLLPTHYAVDADGIAWRQLAWRRRSWPDFRRVVRHRDGLYLSPWRRPHRLDSFRGVFIRFGDADAERIEARVRTHIDAGHVGD